MRRVIDSIVVNAMERSADESVKKYVFDRFGAGTTVKDIHSPQIKFNKSMFGLREFSLTSELNIIASQLKTDADKCYVVVEEDNKKYEVNPDVVNIIKSACLYSYHCPEVLSKGLFEALDIIRYELSGYEAPNTNSEICKYCYTTLKDMIQKAGGICGEWK